jgi:hypothetical protein
MSSILKVDTLQDSGGNTLLTSNGSGTLTTNNVGGQNTPAFAADQQANVTDHFSDNVWTKVTFNVEQFDTANAFDLSNDRFTVPSGQAGKYFFYMKFRGGNTNNNSLDDITIGLYKNGSAYNNTYNNAYAANYPKQIVLNHSEILDLSVGDYIEVYGRFDGVGVDGSLGNARFGGFKIIE